MKKLEKLWAEVVPLKKKAEEAKRVIQRHATEFNRYSRSKIDLERFKLPSKKKVLDVVIEIRRKNPNFDSAEFVRAVEDVRRYFNHLKKIEKATLEEEL